MGAGRGPGIGANEGVLSIYPRSILGTGITRKVEAMGLV